jgi:hypothetical protein
MSRLSRGRIRLSAKPPSVRAHSSIITVEEANELGLAAAHLSRHGGTRFRHALQRLRDLYDLATPALYINVVTAGEGCRIVLVPWERRQVSFSGNGWHLLAGAEAVTGIEAFMQAKRPRRPRLYSSAPDHPLFVVTVDQPGQTEFRGYFPPYLTHLTIVADGNEVVDACRLVHDDGVRVFKVSGGRAA